MKPFSLERFLAGDPVVCRDGTVPSELHYFKTINHGSECIYGVVDGAAMAWFGEGLYCDDGMEHPNDLMMAPRTVERWVWVYPISTTSTTLYSSLQECVNDCQNMLTGHPARVTWEE